MSKLKRASVPPENSRTSVSSGRPSLRLRWAGVSVIVFATWVVYFPALHGEFLLDDNSLLTENLLFRIPDGLYRIWFTSQAQDYWPLTNTSLWIEWHLWNTNPTGYHITNLVLHIAGALLIWKILGKLSVPGAFLAALLFAIHPVNVESVAWIAQRKNALAMVFFLLSILWYLKTEEERSRRGEEQTLWNRWYWLSLLAFLLAMLSKGSVAILPLVLLLIVWWQTGRITARDLVRSAPFFLIAAVLTAVNIWFQTHGSGEVIRTATIAERLAGAGAVLWFYLYKALVPMELLFIYPQWHVEAGNIVWWLPLAAAAVLTVILVWQRNTLWGRPTLFAWSFFVIALFPVLGFFDVGYMKFSLVANHYQHIALIGVMALLAAACIEWFRKSRAFMRFVVAGVVFVLVVSRMFLTWEQCALFGNPLLLYQASLNKNPNSWVLHQWAGIELGKANQLSEAAAEYQQAIRLNPDDSISHYNFANLLDGVGRSEEAIQNYQEALRTDPDNPLVQNNLAIVLVKMNRVPDAIAHYEAALRIAPYYADAHYNLANALVRLDRVTEAIGHYQKAEELARSQGQISRAEQIENRLKDFRSQINDRARQPSATTPSAAQ